MENEKLIAQQPQSDSFQLLIDIAAEAKRAQRSEQHYLRLCADLDNTVNSLKHERTNLTHVCEEQRLTIAHLMTKLKRKK